MAADSFSPRAQEPDEPSRLRALGIAAFLMLATAFLYTAMDGIQRANELAERRQRIAQSACHSCTLGDDGDVAYDDEADAIAPATEAPATVVTDTAADAPATLPAAAPTPTATAATTAPAEPTVPAPVIPILAPTGKP